MRGIKAKRLRRQVYGDMSLRLRRYRRLGNGMVIRDDLRRQYQRLKKEEKT